jgi:hypothetical protein
MTVLGTELEGDEVFLAGLALEIAESLLEGDFFFLQQYRSECLHKGRAR